MPHRVTTHGLARRTEELDIWGLLITTRSTHGYLGRRWFALERDLIDVFSHESICDPVRPQNDLMHRSQSP